MQPLGCLEVSESIYQVILRRGIPLVPFVEEKEPPIKADKPKKRKNL
jgi:hypothetical protein